MATQYNVTYDSDNTNGITTAYAYEYDANYIDVISEYIVWPSFGDVYDVPKSMGDQVKVHRLTALTITQTVAGIPDTLTEATPPDGQYIVKTAIYLDVSQYGEAVFVSDRLEFQDMDPNIKIATELLGEWTANVRDYNARATLCGGSNVWYVDDEDSEDGANTAAVNGAITKSLLEKMIRYADDNKMRPWKPAITATDGVGTTPLPKRIPVIITSKQKFDLRMLVGESNGFVPAHLYPSGDRIHVAEIGSYDCLAFVMTDNPQIELDAGGTTSPSVLYYSDDDTNVDVHSMVMVGRHSYAVGKMLALDLQDDHSHAFVEIFAKQLGSAGTKDPIDQVASVGVKFYDIAGLLLTEHVLEVQTAVTINGTTS